MSEDCLYLNVWTPAKSGNKSGNESGKERLPVMVYFYGGGFVAGDGSEPRYDGESMAAKGIVTVTTNYRLGVFGFLAHSELTGESPHHASGNYDDYKVSKVMQEYFANFIKKGDPNGRGLPAWAAANKSGGGADAATVMRLDVESRAEPDKHRARYLFLDKSSQKP